MIITGRSVALFSDSDDETLRIDSEFEQKSVDILTAIVRCRRARKEYGVEYMISRRVFDLIPAENTEEEEEETLPPVSPDLSHKISRFCASRAGRLHRALISQMELHLEERRCEPGSCYPKLKIPVKTPDEMGALLRRARR